MDSAIKIGKPLLDVDKIGPHPCLRFFCLAGWQNIASCSAQMCCSAQNGARRFFAFLLSFRLTTEWHSVASHLDSTGASPSYSTSGALHAFLLYVPACLIQSILCIVSRPNQSTTPVQRFYTTQLHFLQQCITLYYNLYIVWNAF